MKRLAITFFTAVFCALVIAAAGIYGYGYFNKRLSPSPLPADVVAAENALAVPGLIAIGRFDVFFARRLEEVLAGFGDEDALPNPVRDDRSFFGLIKSAGVDFTQQIDHALAASVLSDSGAQAVALMFGKFPADRIRDALNGAYDIAQETAGTHGLLILTRKNPERCEAPENFALSLTESRIIFGNKELVARTLDRLNTKAEPLIELRQWREFSHDRIFAAALLLPGEAAKMTTQPVASAALGGIKEKMSDLKAIFIGGKPQIFPLGLEMEARFAATKEWAQKSEEFLTAWRATTVAQIGETLPSLAALLESLSISASGRKLILEASIDDELNKNITNLPGEVMSFMFGNFTLAGNDTAAEQTVAPDTLPQFVAETAHDKLPPFAKENFNAAAVNGPFGIRVKNLQLKTLADGDVVEITLETRSSDIPNTPSDNSHIGITGDSFASIQIAHAYDSAGNDLLRDESCGIERNGKPGPLSSTTAGRFVGNEFKGFTELNGEKTLRLKPGANPEAIARLEGSIKLRLPVKTRTLHIKPPFSGKFVQNDKARIRFLPAQANSLRYQISGQTEMVLDVRAQNAKNEYLASSGATAMDRIFDAGRIVEREYKGKPAWAEVVFADEIVEKDYPFVIEKFMPQFSGWDFPEGFTVGTMSKEAFLAAPPAKPGESLQNCKLDAKAQLTLPPLTLCPWESFWALGKKISGRFEFVLPNLPALANNPSAAEITLKKINLKADEKNPQGLATDVNATALAQLSQMEPQTKTIENSMTLEFETPEGIKPEQIESIEGQITLRLPTALQTMTLDTRKLGNSAVNLALFDQGTETPIVASARLSAMAEGRIEIEIQGDRTKIVQLVPHGPKGAVIKTMTPVMRITGPDRTVYSLSVERRPATVDIVYAPTQDKISYDFEIPALTQNNSGQ